MPSVQRFRNGRNVFRRVAAAAARDIYQATLRELAEETRHVIRFQIKPVGESGFGNPAFG